MPKVRKTEPPPEPPLVEATPEERLTRLDRLLGDALSVSNVTIRRKLEAEKRARKRKRR
jgi:hypothetical protein